MEKKHFLLKLNPARNDFAETMTDDEKEVMQLHVQYCMGFRDNGTIKAFGPVRDPQGTYGVAILAVDDEQEIIDFINGDPASALNKYEYFPMTAIFSK